MAETLTLTPHHNGKLGVVHVAVTEDHTLYVAGERTRVADGEEKVLSRSGITVRRNGDEYTFTR